MKGLANFEIKNISKDNTRRLYYLSEFDRDDSFVTKCKIRANEIFAEVSQFSMLDWLTIAAALGVVFAAGFAVGVEWSHQQLAELLTKHKEIYGW